MTYQPGDTVYIGKPSPNKTRWTVVQDYGDGHLLIRSDRGVGGRAPRTRIVSPDQITKE